MDAIVYTKSGKLKQVPLSIVGSFFELVMSEKYLLLNVVENGRKYVSSESTPFEVYLQFETLSASIIDDTLFREIGKLIINPLLLNELNIYSCCQNNMVNVDVRVFSTNQNKEIYYTDGVIFDNTGDEPMNFGNYSKFVLKNLVTEVEYEFKARTNLNTPSVIQIPRGRYSLVNGSFGVSSGQNDAPSVHSQFSIDVSFTPQINSGDVLENDFGIYTNVDLKMIHNWISR